MSGRPLTVSELVPQTVVVVTTQGRPPVTMWVVQVTANYVHLAMSPQPDGAIFFAARRTGDDREAITDDSGIPMQLYRYLREP